MQLKRLLALSTVLGIPPFLISPIAAQAANRGESAVSR
jgi:hypothetical protein